MDTEERDKLILECPECGAENNWHFVMYYGDECFNCDFDIRTYVREKSYNKNKMEG